MFRPHFNIVFFWGGGSISSEPGFGGKYSKIDIQQDCSSRLVKRQTPFGYFSN